MAQKAKCLTRKINHLKKKSSWQKQFMKNVRRNIKDKVCGKMHGEKLSRIGIYRKWLVFSNVSKFVFFRDWT